MTELIYLSIGLLAGLVAAILVWIVYLKKLQKQQAVFTVQEKELLNRIADREKVAAIAEERARQSGEEVSGLVSKLEESREQILVLRSEQTRLGTEKENLIKRLEEHKAEIDQIQQKMKLEFENLAHQILKKNSEDLSNYNRDKVEEILKPFKDKIQQLETNVTQSYEKSLKDTTALQTEVKSLYELSRKLGEEANNLTRALKGDVKKQGNWGEVVLERILERSGLRKGSEYEIQSSTTDEYGRILRPDVVIHLPDQKHLIIDSKVSLLAYEQLVNCEHEEDRRKLLKAHTDSVRTHIKLLAGKHYQKGQHLNSPDFVLMFLPIEASFSLAVQEDQDLFNFAWDFRIVCVSPSTLLATLITIASMWKQELQTRNALEIANQSGSMYDKLVGFIEDMDKIGKSLETLQKSYNEAIGKLSTGRGNLISKAERIREMGARTGKQIPGRYLADTDDQKEEDDA